MHLDGFPDRDDVTAEPALPAIAHDDRAKLYADLLAAHGGLLRAFDGGRILKSEVDRARGLFDAAQSAVVVQAEPGIAGAAENLRKAWEPRLHGGQPPSNWRERVDAARAGFLEAVTP